jgi:hypothetical protein
MQYYFSYEYLVQPNAENALVDKINNVYLDLNWRPDLNDEVYIFILYRIILWQSLEELGKEKKKGKESENLIMQRTGMYGYKDPHTHPTSKFVKFAVIDR